MFYCTSLEPFFVCVFFLFFFVCVFFFFLWGGGGGCKSQYHDTHSENTIGNVRDTDYLSFVSSC